MADTSEYKDAFDLIDADNDGLISPEEFQALMRALGTEVSLDTAQLGVKTHDGDGDGRLTLEEFTAFMNSGKS